MALSTLLEIVTRACDELGITRPTTVFGSSLLQDRQMLGLLQAAGRDLMQSHQWSTLIATASVTPQTSIQSGAITGYYALPTDFDRLLDDAAWDRINQFKMMGGITPQRHQYWLSSGQVGVTTRKEYRLILKTGSNGLNLVYLHPSPETVADVLHFLYVRNTWVHNGTSFVEEFDNDTNITVFTPQLMVKELKWRWRSAKGLDSTDLIAERNALKDQLIAADLNLPPLDMGGQMLLDPIDTIVPDSNWTNLV